MSEKQASEAKSFGLTLLYKATKEFGKGYQNYNYYRFDDCKHEGYFQPTHARRGNVACKECQEKRYQEIAIQNGYSIVGKGHTTNHRLYERLVCGHTEERLVTSIVNTKNTAITCKPCYDLKLAKEAENQNMTYLGAAENRAGVYRRYRFNLCGHEREVNAPAVARGAVICNVCDNDKYNNPSNIYVVKLTQSNFSWLKVGVARNFEDRYRGYGLSNKVSCEKLLFVPVRTYLQALLHEKEFHLQNQQKRLDKEVMKNYHKSSGFTECYPTEMQSEILEHFINMQERINE